MTVRIEISFGELVDRLTILEIKASRIEAPLKLVNIREELASLSKSWVESVGPEISPDIFKIRQALKRVNEILWDVEDAIRDHERNKNFGESFIELARKVYVTNDERAQLKKRIDALMGSRFSEEKSYRAY